MPKDGYEWINKLWQLVGIWRMFLQVRRCLSVHVGGWQTPLQADTTPAPAQCMVGYGQQTGGTHSTGMQSCKKKSLKKSLKKVGGDLQSLNWAQFMLQWFLDSLNLLKVLLYLRKTPLLTYSGAWRSIHHRMRYRSLHFSFLKIHIIIMIILKTISFSRFSTTLRFVTDIVPLYHVSDSDSGSLQFF